MILVTGGTGFLGSTLIDQLLTKGKTVRAIKRPNAVIPAFLNKRPGLLWVDGDVLDYFSLEEAFEGVTQVYHCAALVSYQPSDKERMLRVNVEGTAHIVNLCLKCDARLIHVSSIAALGDAKTGNLVTEDDILEFNSKLSGYSIAKYESEMEVWRGVTEGLNANIVNPSLIIGQSSGNKGSGAIFYVLSRGLKFFPGGSVGLVDVEDVAKAMILLMEKSEVKGRRFIVNNINMSHRELLSKCSNLMNKPVPSKLATPLMLGIAWRFSCLQSLITGKKPALTKESAEISSKKLGYSNHKLLNTIEIDFKPIEVTLKEICERVMNTQTN